MSVAVDVRSSQKVEWVAAVVRKDRSELESPEDPRSVKRAGQNSGNYHLVPLVKIRQRTVTLQTRCVERRVITIKVRDVIDRLAQGVVGQDGEMIGKSFFHFHNPAVVDRRAR